jgi:hypothetical protein
VTCALTLASIPVQVGINECFSVLVANGGRWPTLLQACNLHSLLLILSTIARRTVTAEAAVISGRLLPGDFALDDAVTGVT